MFDFKYKKPIMIAEIGCNHKGDLEIAKERNSIRERKVPEHVLEIMSKSLSDLPPEITDGFDLIVTLDEEQKLIDAEMMLEQKIIYKEFGKLS
mgnify:CR=1 FL=1